MRKIDLIILDAVRYKNSLRYGNTVITTSYKEPDLVTCVYERERLICRIIRNVSMGVLVSAEFNMHGFITRLSRSRMNIIFEALRIPRRVVLCRNKFLIYNIKDGSNIVYNGLEYIYRNRLKVEL